LVDTSLHQTGGSHEQNEDDDFTKKQNKTGDRTMVIWEASCSLYAFIANGLSYDEKSGKLKSLLGPENSRFM